MQAASSKGGIVDSIPNSSEELQREREGQQRAMREKNNEARTGEKASRVPEPAPESQAGLEGKVLKDAAEGEQPA